MTEGLASSVRTRVRLELYWIPLGAGARVVRASGRIYEAIAASVRRRPRCDLYHSALVATVGDVPVYIEMAPVFDDRGRPDRGVVAHGPVGSHLLGRFRMFRYEVRRWPNGLIPDLRYAIASPVPITDEATIVNRVLDLLPSVPTPVWGRDELRTGEMWNSNSVVSWVLSMAGLTALAGSPPKGGRAPGWDAGVVVAHRSRNGVL